MVLYHYKAFEAGGKKLTGTLSADTELQAQEQLRRQKLFITSLKAIQEQEKEQVFSSAFVLLFTRELAQLLKVGLPLYESLQTLEEKYRTHKAHPLFLNLLEALQHGSSFSKALERYPHTFDQIYLCMVRAAEETGTLDHTFEQLEALTARQQKLKKQLISAAAYPAFLAGFCFLVVCALLFFVIPSMKELFEGRDLQLLTRLVLATSSFLCTYGLHLLGGVVLVGTGFLWLITRPSAKYKLQKIFLTLPFLKTIVLDAALIRFCRASSLLLNGGLPLLEALKLARGIMHNRPLEHVIEKAEKKVVEGYPFTMELKKSSLIPPLMIRMLGIGEETGKIAVMMRNIADIYEEELEKNLSQLLTFLQPLLLLLLGLIVGLVLLSVLLPLTDVGSMIT